jgi:hypothetical protein
MAGTRLVYAVEFHLGGVHRYATEAITVGGEPYLSGLLLESVPVERTGTAQVIPISVSSGVDWAALVAAEQFEVASGGAVTVTRVLLEDGAQIDMVVSRGVVAEVTYGEVGDVLSFVVERWSSAAGTLIRPQAIIDDSTSPDTSLGPSFHIPGAFEGAAYPVIIGYPGTFASGVPKAVVPVMSPSWNNIGSRYMVSDGVIDAAQVRLVNQKFNASATVAVITSEPDLLGRDVTLVASTLAVTPAATEEDTVLIVGFQDAVGWGGGLMVAGAVLRGGADIVVWALQLAGARLDRGRIEAHKALFNAYKFDTWISDPSLAPWEWLDAVILPWLPGIVVESEHGYWIAPMRMNATALDATLRIDADADPLVTRTSQVKPWLSGGIVNELTIEYSPNASGDYYHSRSIVTSQYELVPHQYDVAIDERVVPHRRALVSQAMHGVLSETVQIPVVWHVPTAHRIGADILDQRALHRQAVDYRLPLSASHVAVEHGDIALLTDSRVSMASRVCLVERVTATPAGVDVSLVLL